MLMSYLFGDSTPSPFRINFIEFLRLATGFSVHVLKVEERVVAEQARRVKLEHDADADRQRLDQMLARLIEAIEQAAAGARPRITEHAENIQRKAQEVIQSGLQALESHLAEDLAEIEQSIRQERKSCLNALEMVLLAYDLPEAKDTIRVGLSEAGRYSAWLESVTPYRLETVLELAIPPESPFAHDGRVDRLIDGLEIHAPETAGWIRKESKMVPHKLGRFHITDLAIGGAEAVIKLRSSLEPHASGYDIEFHAEEPRVRLAKTGKDAGDVDPFDPEPTDVPNLLRFRDRLEEMGRSLATKRRTLSSAKLDDKSLEESAGLRSLVEQLILVLAPMVREIAAHSLSPDELVLRRMTADDRREEIFVGKSELRANLDTLGADDRRLFAPLGFDEMRSDEQAAAARPTAGSPGDGSELPDGSRARQNGSIRPPPLSRPNVTAGRDD
jgi:F0F1-type ATP synthase membrane subunit b/b'